MTAFEIAIPLIALAVAAAGTLVFRMKTRRLDARIAARQSSQTPAE